MTTTPPATTRSALRFPAPDLARGFMLLLIALANVTYWMPGPDSPTGADSWWVLVRSALVDQRAYPLFACLFGFGIATIAMRRRARDGGDPAPARGLVRRRGWWLLAFGLVHAFLFAGDIIGLYGLVAVLLAGAVSRDRMRWPVVAATAVLVVVPLVLLSMPSDGGRGAGAGAGGTPTSTGDGDLTWPVKNLVDWTVGTVGGLALSLVLVAAVAGVFLARTTLLSRPGEHLRALTGIAVGGLAVGVLTSLPHGLGQAGLATPPSWAFALSTVGGLAGGAGWLACFALLGAAVSRASAGGRTGGPWSPTGVITAAGRRSMTGYVGQSVIFALATWGLKASGAFSDLTHLAAARIALAAWLLMALVCAALGAAGRQGPFERLLRDLVSRDRAPPGRLPTKHLLGKENPSS